MHHDFRKSSRVIASLHLSDSSAFSSSVPFRSHLHNVADEPGRSQCKEALTCVAESKSIRPCPAARGLTFVCGCPTIECAQENSERPPMCRKASLLPVLIIACAYQPGNDGFQSYPRALCSQDRILRRCDSDGWLRVRSLCGGDIGSLSISSDQ